MDTNPKSAKKVTKKKKAATYRVEIWNRRFRECRNTQTGDFPVMIPQLIEVKDHTLSIDDWLVKICEKRHAVVITCKNERFGDDLLYVTTIPLRSGTIYLQRDFDDIANVFFKEPNYDELLRRRGIFHTERKDNLNVEYSGRWHDTWVTGSGKSRIPDQDLFWAMSDEVSTACQIILPDGLAGVLSPLDDQLPLYDGKILYHPTSASWVVTYEAHRHNGSVSSGATLHIKPECELDTVISQLDDYLKQMSYRSFDDCLKMVTYLDYATSV